MLCFKDVTKIVAEALNSVYYNKIKAEDINPKSFFDDIGFDYPSYKKLSYLIYEYLKIEISTKDLCSFKTIGSLYIYIDCYRLLKR